MATSASPLASPVPPALLEAFNKSLGYFSDLSDLGARIPGSQIAWRYFKASHQNDPFRTLLEIALVFFIFRTYAQSRTKGEASGKNFVKLSEKEIDELVSEWTPEALVAPVKPLSLPPVIIGPTGPRPRVLFPNVANDPHDPNSQISFETGGKVVLNLASVNFGGLVGNERLRDKAVDCLRRYGVGSCGPPGFYGTFDVHLELERDIASFLSVPAAIIYSHAFSTISSVIPSFSKRGDIIVADRGVNFAIQKGIQISRSTVKWYDHGDYESLERVLEGIRKEDKRYGRKPTASRRFIVTEGIFENDGSMVDLPKVMELKLKHKFRLILDENWSFGAVGKTGRGVTEVFDIPTASIDIMTGSMANAFASGGGFCVGSPDVVNHQRINSPGFVFSAALPPLLAIASSEAISLLSTSVNSTDPPHPLANLPENVRALRNILDGINSIEIPSAVASPMIHIMIRPTPYAQRHTGMVSESSRDEQERKLQEVVDHCAENGVLVTRSRRNWDQEMVENRPSLKICVSSALTKKEVEKAGTILKTALIKILGKGRKGIDIQLLQADKGGDLKSVLTSQEKRFADPKLVDEVNEMYKEWVKVDFARNQKQKEVNAKQKEIGAKRKNKEDATELQAEKAALDKEVVDLAAESKEKEEAMRRKAGTIGNLVHDSVPVSNTEDDNRVERTFHPDGMTPNGEMTKPQKGVGRTMTENILSHDEVMMRLDILEMDRGAKVAGHRGFYLTGDGVDLNQAMINYGLDFLREKKFKKIMPPFFMNRNVMSKTAQLEEFDEALYKIEGGEDTEKYLIATSEQPISALHSDEWFDQPQTQLPLRYAGYSTCFRKEAGSSGRDVLGIFRIHQFEKVEQFVITDPSSSWAMFDDMIANSEEFYQSLGLPYQLISIVSGALNNAAAKKYDLEAWFPHQGEYKELVSVSNCTDYQSRALEIRCGVKKQGDNKKVYVHMLNGTLCATERALCCLVENYQTPEGVVIPEVLRKYMQGRDFLPYVKDKVVKRK